MSDGRERLASSGWRWRHSVWIVIPPLTLGILTWAAFFYAGTRARRRAWLLAAGGYLVALVVGLGSVLAAVPQEPGRADAIGVLLWIVLCWIGGTVHAIAIRPEYLRDLAAVHPWPPHTALASGAKSPGAPPTPSVSGDAAHTLGLDEEQARLFATDRVAGSRTNRQDPVPLNTVGEADLASLPGLDPILAKRIVNERQRRGGFDAVEDLAECGVPPHVVVRLRSVFDIDRIASQHPPRERRARTLDL